jgi:hypothetical protein
MFTFLLAASRILGYNAGKRGFVWVPLTDMLLLPSLHGDSQSSTYAINDAGVVVGRSFLPDPNTVGNLHVAAVHWDNGTPTDLLSLVTNGHGWALISPVVMRSARTQMKRCSPISQVFFTATNCEELSDGLYASVRATSALRRQRSCPCPVRIR